VPDDASILGVRALLGNDVRARFDCAWLQRVPFPARPSAIRQVGCAGFILETALGQRSSIMASRAVRARRLA